MWRALKNFFEEIAHFVSKNLHMCNFFCTFAPDLGASEFDSV